MAHLVLFMIRQLGDRPRPLGDEEDGVITETAASARLDDLTLTLAANRPHRFIRRGESERGDEPRPPGPRVTGKGGQEDVDALGRRGGQARRANPWRAGQRLHLEPAVITQGALAHRPGCGDRLRSGIFLVCLTDLINVGRVADDLYAGWSQ